MTVYPFIAAEKEAGHNVEHACATLTVSRSAYYGWEKTKTAPRQRAAEDARLSRQVAAIHRQSRGTYGAPRVLAQLKREGVPCSKKRVARLLKAQGLCGRQKRKTRQTTMADPKAEGVQLDLLQRGFAPEKLKPDQAWVGDISYLRTWEGWAYLATVIDLSSRRVVGFAVADHMRTELVARALEMAIARRQPPAGLIFHSDRGSQYTSTAYRTLLERHGIRQSVSRPRQCWDNAVAESFFATLKMDMVNRQPIPTKQAAREAVFEYIEVFYNRQRLHSSLGYKTPVEYEEEHCPTITAVPAA